MNKEQLLQLAKSKIDSRRLKAVSQCERTLEMLRSHADWNACEHALKAAQVRVALLGDETARDTVTAQTAQKAKLLKKYHLTEEDLLPKFHCKKCEDTGYVNGTVCSCLRMEICNILANNSNVRYREFTFDNSTETNKHNLAVYKKAKEVCQNDALFNILLMGNTGCGKTYLLTACANLCISLGKSVMFTTAYNLSSLFLEAHLSDLATKQTILSNLTDVDVLVIDDLGTEKVYRDVTATSLFALLNERIVMNKQTFINTNLTLQQIRERYDERIFSRLVDQKITFVAQLEGGDKRLKK